MVGGVSNKLVSGVVNIRIGQIYDGVVTEVAHR